MSESMGSGFPVRSARFPGQPGSGFRSGSGQVSPVSRSVSPVSRSTGIRFPGQVSPVSRSTGLRFAGQVSPVCRSTGIRFPGHGQPGSGFPFRSAWFPDQPGSVFPVRSARFPVVGEPGDRADRETALTGKPGNRGGARSGSGHPGGAML